MPGLLVFPRLVLGLEKLIDQGATGTVQLPLTFADLATTNQDNCKGATVSFSFTANADQA